ncbi:NTF2 fold immunity protein [Mucilaginibacter sp. UYCu711]|uniref:NTF2 fold immunity protein n=1 Tax=Mucilaginibacter sp. UYCu711 TaxID=3156339 RepID=UPI003D1D1641
MPFLALGQSKAGSKVINDTLTSETSLQLGITILPDKATAIAVAEPILFKAYGKKLIMSERPYNTKLVKGNWIITGYMPKSTPGDLVGGGTFLIIMSSKDGRVIKLTHYQ